MCVQRWGGPLSVEFLHLQRELTRKILARIRSLGMKAVRCALQPAHSLHGLEAQRRMRYGMPPAAYATEACADLQSARPIGRDSTVTAMVCWQVLPAFHGHSVSNVRLTFGGVVCAIPRRFRRCVIRTCSIVSTLRYSRARTRAPHGGGRSRADDGPASRADACARMVCVQRSATAARQRGWPLPQRCLCPECRAVCCSDALEYPPVAPKYT